MEQEFLSTHWGAKHSPNGLPGKNTCSAPFPEATRRFVDFDGFFSSLQGDSAISWPLLCKKCKRKLLSKWMRYIVGGFKYVLFSSLFGEKIPIWLIYFSNGLKQKPPTRWDTVYEMMKVEGLSIRAMEDDRKALQYDKLQWILMASQHTTP